MMKANELRIGNLVEAYLEPPISEWIVTEVHPRTLLNITEKPETHGYRPIPLTGEWLLKFGFKKVIFDSEEQGYGFEYTIPLIEKNEYIVVCDDMSVGTYSGGDFAFAHVIYPNKYHVHQLQNLYFALTGEELTLDK